MFPDLLILLSLLAPRPPLRGAGILSQVADPEGWGGRGSAVGCGAESAKADKSTLYALAAEGTR